MFLHWWLYYAGPLSYVTTMFSLFVLWESRIKKTASWRILVYWPPSLLRCAWEKERCVYRQTDFVQKMSTSSGFISCSFTSMSVDNMCFWELTTWHALIKTKIHVTYIRAWCKDRRLIVRHARFTVFWQFLARLTILAFCLPSLQYKCYHGNIMIERYRCGKTFIGRCSLCR